MEKKVIDQKEYLKKYLSSGNGDDKKKKKKKKLKVGPKTVRIIDDDIDLKNMRPLNENEVHVYIDAEEAPLVAGVVDERGSVDFTNKKRWKIISNDQDGTLTVTSHDEDTKKPKIVDDDLTPPRKRTRCSDDDLSPPRTSKSLRKQNHKRSVRENNHTDSDLSPPRRKSRKHDSNDGSNSETDDSSHKKKKKMKRKKKESDSDLSPPRRRSRKHDSDNGSNTETDDSSHRKKKKMKRKKKESDSDLSPPRRKSKKYDRDIGSNTETDNLSHKMKQKMRRKKKESDSDLSPPRKHKHRDSHSNRHKEKRDHRYSDKNSKSDRRYDSDISPPRRKNRDLDRDRSRSEKYENDSKHHYHKGGSHRKEKFMRDTSDDKRVESRHRGDREDNEKRMKKTLDGKTAGLQDARALREETEAHKKRETEQFSKLSKEVTGVGQATVLRDSKTGRKRNLEAEAVEEREKQKRQAELNEKYAKWGKGLKQVQDHEDKLKDDLYEMSKPLARYADDPDLDKRLREQEREGDPMLEYIKKKQIKEGKRQPDRPRYEGSFMPNRFGVKPGHRWDGVDRSNGYEKRWFEAQNARVAVQEEAYKWSTSDM